MLKQCRVRECRFGKHRVYLYHDGKLISEMEWWDGDQLDRYLEKLEAEGYVECYSSEEIEEAKRVYEYHSKHAVGGAPHWTGMEGDICSECGASLTEIMDADSYFAIGFEPSDLVACPFCGARMFKGDE